MEPIVFLRVPAVLSRRGSSKSTLYADIQSGLFPKPVRIGVRAKAWPEAETEKINQARLAGKSDDEIRALVEAIHQARTGSAS